MVAGYRCEGEGERSRESAEAQLCLHGPCGGHVLAHSVPGRSSSLPTSLAGLLWTRGGMNRESSLQFYETARIQSVAVSPGPVFRHAVPASAPGKELRERVGERTDPRCCSGVVAAPGHVLLRPRHFNLPLVSPLRTLSLVNCETPAASLLSHAYGLPSFPGPQPDGSHAGGSGLPRRVALTEESVVMLRLTLTSVGSPFRVRPCSGASCWRTPSPV